MQCHFPQIIGTVVLGVIVIAGIYYVITYGGLIKLDIGSLSALGFSLENLSFCIGSKDAIQKISKYIQ